MVRAYNNLGKRCEFATSRLFAGYRVLKSHINFKLVYRRSNEFLLGLYNAQRPHCTPYDDLPIYSLSFHLSNFLAQLALAMNQSHAITAYKCINH